MSLALIGEGNRSVPRGVSDAYRREVNAGRTARCATSTGISVSSPGRSSTCSMAEDRIAAISLAGTCSSSTTSTR